MTTTLEPPLLAHGLTVHRGGVPILHEVSVAFRPGAVHALVGPNGAGKSTLLAALAGDLHASSGRVELFGDSPADQHAKIVARRRAVVPQQFLVPFAFSCGEIVEMGRAPWQPSDADPGIVAQSLATTGAAAFADRAFSSLSGGERALVVLAKALAQTAPVLLLDEPTAALDIQHTEQVLKIVKDRAAAGDTVVIVVHDLSLAAAWADDVTVLEHGRVAASGLPADVLTGPLLSRVYGCSIEVLPHPRTGIPLILPIRDNIVGPSQ